MVAMQDDERNPNQEDELTVGDDELETNSEIVEEALLQLPNVRVSGDFLPTVMGRVYKHHTRTNISMPQLILVTLLLLATSLGFFVWDVVDYQHQSQLDSFGQAYNHKVNRVLTNVDHSFSDSTGILTASWQMLTGVGALAIRADNLIIIGVMVLILIAIGVLIRKSINALYRTPS